jgi:DNA mismatch repair protein MutS2
MNEHALGVLEFDKIVRMLVDRTSFELGAERAARLSPGFDILSITEDLERTSEVRSILDAGERLPIRGASDIRAALERSRLKGASLSCQELTDTRATLEVVRASRAFLSSRSASHPKLWLLAEELTAHDDLEHAISRAIDEESLEVRDSASKELSGIRRSIGRTRTRLEEKLQGIVSRELRDGTIQEPAVHIRNGRHVLPVKRAARSRLKGIIHDQSASGATLFVEPMSTVTLNNELAGLAVEERREVERILKGLSAAVGAEADRIERSLAIVGELDFYTASARLSSDLDGARPTLNTDGRLRIRGGRHPVLCETVSAVGGEVVPLDLELGPDATTLVVSGPNAGGKTVTIKTVGILVLMAQAGLHVPALPDTELPVLRDVFADIGDEQSIEQSLSTFSSHMKVISEILANAEDDTLVLVDEIGAGTDPEEGASLAVAVLDELTERRVPTVATTHLGSIKSHVHTRRGMVNGSMAFDPETLEPTFRFAPGVPGASHALAIAGALGFPARLIERARRFRDEGEARVDELLTDLMTRERRLEETLRGAEEERERARQLSSDYEDRLAGAREERKRIKQKALAEARDIVERGQSLVEQTVRELRAKEAASRTIREAREKLRRRRAEVAEELEHERRADSDDGGRRPEELTAGMAVRIARFGRLGTLLDLPDGKGKVRVRVKNATVEVDADDLREVDKSGPADGGPESKVSFNVTVDESPATELHLLGMTTDEAVDAIERFVSRAIVQGFTTIRIVHGKGTGALRSRTHEILRELPSVKSFRLGRWGEGDTGVTIVELA